MRDFIRQFLLYTRSERRAVIALVLLILAVVIIPKAYIFYSTHADKPTTDSALQKEIAQWQEKGKDPEPVVDDTVQTAITEGKTFHDLSTFDPNTIGVADWLRLGISQKQAEGIEKYKAKGGYFHKADDLRRLYSLTEADKERLIPLVRISLANGATSKTNSTIEINAADSTAFESLYGIGPVLAARIVKHRTQLGGFISVDQVGEVSGIREEVFTEIRPRLRVDAAAVHRLSINDADYETLRRHPYIHAAIAHAIIGYRDSHGKFGQIEQLKQLKPVTMEVYQKIAPYLSL